jgi:hypothetical protein
MNESLKITNSLRQHQIAADQAFKTLSAALDKDSLEGDVEGALELYKRGIRELRTALRMQFSSNEER